MKLICHCDQALQAAHIANVLRAAGMACTVRNVTLGSGIGDIPFLECAPQVWVDNDLDEAHARALLAEIKTADSEPQHAASWYCHCGEPIEPQFGACWRCGASRFSPA